VPTFRFRILFVFLILAHERRRIVHFNVTAHPTAEWAAQQIAEAFPEDSAPRFLVRDRDGITRKVWTRFLSPTSLGNLGQHGENRTLTTVRGSASERRAAPFRQRSASAMIAQQERHVLSAVKWSGRVEALYCFGHRF
jgi:hypothetical protein